MQAVTALFDAHLGDVGAYPNDERQDRGWRALLVAERARCTASDDEAAAWLAARETYRESRIPWEEAYCGWRLAAALVRQGALRAQVREVLRDAYAIAERLGAAPLVSRLDDVARAAHVRLDAVPTLETPRRTGGPLSEREQQVLDLVIVGRTNAEIAATLFISAKTAGTHVSNILRKTGCRNRIEAAAWGQRLASLGSAAPGNTEVSRRI
jgi:DNA-binding CsgD family transcriptional regulator